MMFALRSIADMQPVFLTQLAKKRPNCVMAITPINNQEKPASTTSGFAPTIGGEAGPTGLFSGSKISVRLGSVKTCLSIVIEFATAFVLGNVMGGSSSCGICPLSLVKPQ
jgi:hypothetical protein